MFGKELLLTKQWNIARKWSIIYKTDWSVSTKSNKDKWRTIEKKKL